MDSKLQQYRNFRLFKRDFDYSLQESPGDRVNLLLTFIMFDGGKVADANFLAMLHFLNIDFNDETIMDEIHRLLAFYSGGGLIELIDTGLNIGIDKDSQYYISGTEMDFTEFKVQIKKLYEKHFISQEGL